MLKIYTNAASRRHDTGINHPERAARLDAAIEGVERAGLSSVLLRDIDVHPDTSRIIHKVHSADYERELEHAVRAGNRYFHSLDNPISSASFAAARAAVATSLAAADDIYRQNASKRAFVIARPPGHHAERAQAMGFCFFNNVAVAARHARDAHGIERVLVFDWDVHHGNGTNDIFSASRQVLFASIHQYPWYPGTGPLTDVGSGHGEGGAGSMPEPSRAPRAARGRGAAWPG